MNVFVSGLFWVVCAGVGGALVAYLVRRYGLDEGRPDNNDAAGSAFTIVGGLHSVVVAFVLISLFDTTIKVREGAYAEARSLVAASWAADSLPDPTPQQFAKIARAYAHTVAFQEWPRMQIGADTGTQGWEQLDQLRTTLDAAVLVPGDDYMMRRKFEAAGELVEVYQERQNRLNVIHDNHVGAVLWFVLIVGSVLFVLLSNLLGGTRPLTHVLIVSALAAAAALLCFAIYQLQNPFGSGGKAGPEAFTQAIDRLGGSA